MPQVSIVEYTDPACPFAFSAEPSRWRLRWRYGDQLVFSEHMVVLSESRPRIRRPGSRRRGWCRPGPG